MKRKVLAQLLCIVILLQPFLEALPISAAEPHYTAVVINGGDTTAVSAPDGQPAYQSAFGDGKRIATGVGDQSAYRGKYFVFDVWTGGASMPVSGDLAIVPVGGDGAWWGVGARFATVSKAEADSSDWMTFYVDLTDANIRKEGGNTDGIAGDDVLNISQLGFNLNANGFAGDFIIRNARFQDTPHSPKPVPSVSDDEGDFITLTATATGNSQAVEYAVNDTGEAPGELDWQQSGIFEKPASDPYYIFARAAHNDEFIAGTYSRIAVTAADDQELVDQAADQLESDFWNIIRNANTDQNDVKTRLNLPTTIGTTGVSVAWSSTNSNAISVSGSSLGNVNRLHDRENDKVITLTATITKEDAEPAAKEIMVTVKAAPAATDVLSVTNLSNVTSENLDGEQVSRINRTWTQSENVLHIIDAPPRADLLDYANLYFAFDMYVDDTSLLNLGTNAWFVIDTGNWNNNSRLHIDRAAFANAQPNTWITVWAHLSGDNTQNGFSPSSMDSVNRMGLHLDFAAVPTGFMYIKNVRFQPEEPELDPSTDPGDSGGATAFFDFNDYDGDYTPGEPPSEEKIVGDGISVDRSGDGSPNNMVQPGQQSGWGMEKNSYIYVTVTDQDLKDASRIKVVIEYWRTGNNNNINLQYVSVGDNFRGATAARTSGNNNDWAFAEVTLNDTNFNAGHNQGAQFRVSSPNGITIKSIRLTEVLMTDAESVASASNLLTWNAIRNQNTNQNLVETALTLTNAFANGTEIEWESSHDDVINSETGEVTRQEDNTSVTLKATISKGSEEAVKTFEVTVRGTGTGTDEDAVEDMLEKLTWDLIKGVNSSEDNVTTNLVLPTMGDNMTDISWETDDADLITSTGIIPASRPDAGGNVTLTATVSRGPESDTKDFILIVPDRYDYANYIREAIPQANDAKDYAISDFNVLAFGAKTEAMAAAEGLEDFDNREAFQAAIDAAYNDGGGVVYAPEGVYAFRTSETVSIVVGGEVQVPGTSPVTTLTGVSSSYTYERVLNLHRGVQIRGEWDDPNAEGYDGKIDGTIFAVYAGKGSDNYHTYSREFQREAQANDAKGTNISDRFIDMEQGTGVSNLSIWWPEQDITATTEVSARNENGALEWERVGTSGYNYNLTGRTESVNGIPFPWAFIQRTGNSATIDNVTLVNAWGGFLANPAEMHYIVNTSMTALNLGIVLHTCTDIGRIENVTITPDVWVNSGLPGAPTYADLRAFTRENARAFQMHRSDWEYIAGLNISGYNIAMWLGREIIGTSPPNGHIYNVHIEDSVTGIYFDRVSNAGLLISDSVFAGDQAAYFNEAFDSIVQFNGVDFIGPVVSEGTGGVISFENSTFDNEGDGYALDFKNRGNALLSQNNFKQTDKHVSLSADFGQFKSVNSGYNLDIDNADLAAHINSLAIDVNGGGNTEISITNDVEYIFDPIPRNIKTDIDVHPRPGSTAVLRVDLPRVTGVNNNAPTVDIAEQLQAAIDYLRDNHDGGTVYLPGGRYLLNAPITVHEGIELRGTWDVQHHTQGGGTAIFTTYEGDGNGGGESLIQLKEGAGLRGFNLLQSNITNNYDSHVYPFLIQGQGPDVYAINITIPIADKAIDLASYNTSGHYVDYLGGTVLRAGIWVGGGAVGGFIRNMQFNPHYALRNPEANQGYPNPNNSGSLLYNYIQGNSSALLFADVEDQTIFNNFVFGSVYGVHFLKDAITGNYPGHITMVGHGSDGTTYALYVEDGDEHTNIIGINSQLVNTNIATQEDRAYVRMSSLGDQDSNEPRVDARAQLNLYNTAFWGSPTTAGAVVYNGTLRLQQANFAQLGGVSTPGIDVYGGSAHVYTSNFQPQKAGGNENVYVRLRATGQSVEVSNNYYSSGLTYNSDVEYGIYGSDVAAIPFGVLIAGSDMDKQLEIKYVVRGESGPGEIKMISPSVYADDFTPIKFDSVEAGETLKIDLPYYSTGLIKVQIVMDNGEVYDYTSKYDVAYAEKASVVDEINPAKIAATPVFTMAERDYVKINTGPLSWEGPDDLSAVSSFAWDEDNLYAYVVVTDKQHFNDKAGVDIWNGDSLQFGIDLTRQSGENNMRNELGFALDNEGQIHKHAWTDVPGVADLDNIIVDIKRDDTVKTTTYDLVIPFNTVHASLSSQDLSKLGISIFINDAVDGVRRQDMEVEANHLKTSGMFTELHLLDEGEYNEKLEASAGAAVQKALDSEADADVAVARNFVAVLADSAVKSNFIQMLSVFDEEDNGSDPGTPSSPTIPAVPGTAIITPPVSISGNKANTAVNEISISNAIAAAKLQSGVDKKVTIRPEIDALAHYNEVSVDLIKSSVTELADAQLLLEINTPLGKLTFDAAALEAIANSAESNSIQITIEDVDNSTLSEEQQNAVGGNKVVDLTIISGDAVISDLRGGSLAVSIPYELKLNEEADGIKLFYLADDGALTEIACVYNEETKSVEFILDHLSMYVIVYDALTEDGEWENPFTDVAEDDWFFGDVRYAYQNELFFGMTAAAFGPNVPMTRGMLVTVLGRLHGVDATKYDGHSFDDVAPGSYYAPYVEWAKENGIVNGIGGDKFAPNADISRQDLAVIVHRYAEFAEKPIPAAVEFEAFPDGDKIADYAKDAIVALYRGGIVNGKPGGFDPAGNASRAEVAAMLHRFANAVK